MSKLEKFIVEAQSILEKYPTYHDISKLEFGNRFDSINEVLTAVKSDLNDVLNNYLSDNALMKGDFPIKFENMLGKWELYEDGTTYVQLKTESGSWEVSI